MTAITRPIRLVVPLLAGVGILNIVSDAARGQQIAIQQPIVSTVSVQTTVWAPDRGAVVLGGTSRAAEALRSGGLWRPGSSYGRTTSTGSMSSHVWIHDLAAMDQALLQSRPVTRPVTSSDRADQAYQTLLARQTGQKTAARRDPLADDPRFSPDRLYRLGEAALERGQTNVGRMHLQMAVKYGSTEAAARLAELDAPPSASVVTAQP